MGSGSLERMRAAIPRGWHLGTGEKTTRHPILVALHRRDRDPGMVGRSIQVMAEV